MSFILNSLLLYYFYYRESLFIPPLFQLIVFKLIFEKHFFYVNNVVPLSEISHLNNCNHSVLFNDYSIWTRALGLLRVHRVRT